MQYVANKTMRLGEKLYEKGDVVEAKDFKAIAPYRQGALLRTRLVVEADIPGPAKKAPAKKVVSQEISEPDNPEENDGNS